MKTLGSRFQTVSEQRLREEVADQDAGEFFDLADPANPVVIRKCRSCAVELRFPFEGGVRPGLLGMLASVACEQCAGEELAAEERGKAKADVERRIGKAGIPSALAGEATWDSLLERGKNQEETEQRSKAIAAAREWASTEKPMFGLLLYGDAGTGKTRLAATAAMARLERWPIQWVSVGVLMAQLDGAWNDDERKAALKVLTASGAVVLDDLDKVNPTSRVLGQIFTALDKREQSRQTIIATTNLPPRELGKKFGDVIVSRLRGMCKALPYPGPDRRLELGE